MVSHPDILSDPVTVEFADELNPDTARDPVIVSHSETMRDPPTVEFADELSPATANEPAIV